MENNKRNYYEAFKNMIMKRGASDTPHMDLHDLVDQAGKWLSYLSIRRYVESMTVDSLLEETSAMENPLFFIAPDLEEKKALCERVNEQMRGSYVAFDVSFKDSVHEFVSWCAVFPEKTAELVRRVFPNEKDQDVFVPDSYGIVFTHVCGRSLDELPLPKMIIALNACLFLELMEDGEEELAKRILPPTD